MDKLWAPWRMAYIREALSRNPGGGVESEEGKGSGEGERGEEGGCVLCEIGKASAERDAENLVLFRGEHAFVLLNKFPYTNGHLMVTPYDHTCEISELSTQALLELWRLTDHALGALRRAANPDGFNIGANLGRVAGAGIEKHFHLHVVPRWSGDTNFMPVLADVKVISQALSETWAELRAHWPVTPPSRNTSVQ